MKRNAVNRTSHSAGLIRRARDLFGWTQQQFGKRLRVGQVTVARWETGTRTPSPATLKRVHRLVVDELVRRVRRIKHNLSGARDELPQFLAYLPDPDLERPALEQISRVYLHAGLTALVLISARIYAAQVVPLAADGAIDERR